MISGNIYHKISILGGAIILLSLVLFLPAHNYKSFESPDENANYLATKLYASTGKLWYQEDYIHLDYENYLHPRHFVAYEDRVVPTQFLGLPIIYGSLFFIFGEASAIVWTIVFSLLSYIYFIKLATLLFGKKAGLYAPIIFLSNLPLLYYLNMPFYNSTGAMCFFICAIFYLAKFDVSNSNRHLVISTLLFSLSILFRLDYAVFIGLLVIIVLMNKYRLQIRKYIKPITIVVSIFTIFCIIPVLVLNFEVYRKATTFGTQLLQVSSIGKESMRWWQFCFPYSIIPEIILTNTYRLIFKLLPILSLLSVIGAVYSIRLYKCKPNRLLYLGLFAYILIYFGSSDTYLAYNFNYLGFEISIIRYWLIVYLFISLMATAGMYFIRTRYYTISILVITILLITSITSFLIDNDRSIMRLMESHEYKQYTVEKIKSEIDNKSIVYSDTFDKVLIPNEINAATWWAGEKTYDPIKLVDSMTRLQRESNYSIYLYSTSPYVNVNELNTILERQDLVLEDNPSIKHFYKLEDKLE